MTVSWSASDDSELSSYKLYRKTTGTDWTVIATTSLLTYTDYGRSTSESYEYAVSITDKFGNESDKKPIAAPVTPLADTEKPVINSFSPAAGSTIKKAVNVSVLSADNVAVAKIELFYENTAGTCYNKQRKIHQDRRKSFRQPRLRYISL